MQEYEPQAKHTLETPMKPISFILYDRIRGAQCVLLTIRANGVFTASFVWLDEYQSITYYLISTHGCVLIMNIIAQMSMFHCSSLSNSNVSTNH